MNDIREHQYQVKLTSGTFNTTSRLSGGDYRDALLTRRYGIITAATPIGEQLWVTQENLVGIDEVAVYEFDPRHAQQIELPTDKPVGFKWNAGGINPRGVVLSDGSATEGPKTGIRQTGSMLDAANYTDEPATLTLYIPVTAGE